MTEIHEETSMKKKNNRRKVIFGILSVLLQAVIYGGAIISMAVLEASYLGTEGAHMELSIMLMLPVILIPLVMIFSVLAFLKFRWIKHTLNIISAISIAFFLGVAPHVFLFEGWTDFFGNESLMAISMIMSLWPFLFVIGNIIAVVFPMFAKERANKCESAKQKWQRKNSNKLNVYLSVNLASLVLFCMTEIFCTSIFSTLLQESNPEGMWSSFLLSLIITCILLVGWLVLQIPAILSFKLRDPYGKIFAIISFVLLGIEVAVLAVLTALLLLVAFVWLLLPVVGILMWIFFGPFVVVAGVINLARLIFSFVLLFFRKKYRKEDDELGENCVEVLDAETSTAEASDREASCVVASDSEVI